MKHNFISVKLKFWELLQSCIESTLALWCLIIMHNLLQLRRLWMEKLFLSHWLLIAVKSFALENKSAPKNLNLYVRIYNFLCIVTLLVTCFLKHWFSLKLQTQTQDGSSWGSNKINPECQLLFCRHWNVWSDVLQKKRNQQFPIVLASAPVVSIPIVLPREILRVCRTPLDC